MRIATLTAVLCLLLLGTVSARADLPVLRVAVLQVGTVNWELDTIRHHGLDTANGFTLEVQGMAGAAATMVAFQGDTADMMVTDWLWVARQRAAGKEFVLVPYSRAVGALLVQEGSPAQTLADLRNTKIGIAGGPLDKSWLILRAYAELEYGMDLMAETEQVFAAPPLIYQTALQGGVAGAVNYWHFNAKMQTKGMRKLIDVDDAALALGLDPQTPLLGYVFKGELLRAQPDLVAGFVAASQVAKDILASDETEWDRLRPLMNAKTDAEFTALRDGFRAGIPGRGPVDTAAATRMLDLMARLGGSALTGGASTLPEGVFYAPARP